MKNGIEIKKNIKVTLSIADVFDEEDYLPNGYEYVCKNGLNIHYGYSKDIYQGIIPFIDNCSIWFPYKKEEITYTVSTLNDYSERKKFYEDWEEFYSYLKEKHDKKKTIETTETIEMPLYNINYTKKDNYITNITLTLDPSLFWEEPSTEVSSMIDFTGTHGWKFFYNTNPKTIPCILPGHIKKVWFSGNEHAISYTSSCKMSEKEFEEFVRDVDSFVCDLATKSKLRKSCGEHLVIKQFPINDEEIVTKFTFTVPSHTKFLKYRYKENNWTFFIDHIDDKDVENFISMISKEAFLSFNDNNEATCVYVSKKVPQVSELEKAYNDFLYEVMTIRE